MDIGGDSMNDYDRIKSIEFKAEKTDLLTNPPKQIVAISGEDFEWLIKQAERAQELEDKVDELTGLYNSKNSDYLKEKAMREHSWKLNKRYRVLLKRIDYLLEKAGET